MFQWIPLVKFFLILVSTESIFTSMTTTLRNFVRAVLLEIKMKDVEPRLRSKPFLDWAHKFYKNANHSGWDPYRDPAHPEDDESFDDWFDNNIMSIKGTEGYDDNQTHTLVDDVSRIKNEDQRSQALNWCISRLIDGGMLYEDHEKTVDYISDFFLYKNKLKEKDLNKYRTPADIFVAVKAVKQAGGNAKINPEKVKDVRKIGENEHSAVYQPLTVEASCALGKGTEWCTAKYPPGDRRNMFSYYTEGNSFGELGGPLYICFDKKTGKRYQIHFETSQYMDEDDSPIEPDTLLPAFEILTHNKQKVENADQLPYFFVEDDGNDRWIISTASGNIKEWRNKAGERDREDGPARMLKKTGSWSWYRNGKLHRIDGPAVFRKANDQYSRDREEYWINGERLVDKAAFEERKEKMKG